MEDDSAGEFALFYRSSKDACLRAVLASVGDRHLAEDLVAEGFVRALMAWRKGPLPGLSRVVGPAQGSHPIVIQIRPSAMPRGSELLFSITRTNGVVKYVGQELIRVGAPVSCLRPPHAGG